MRIPQASWGTRSPSSTVFAGGFSCNPFGMVPDLTCYRPRPCARWCYLPRKSLCGYHRRKASFQESCFNNDPTRNLKNFRVLLMPFIHFEFFPQFIPSPPRLHLPFPPPLLPLVVNKTSVSHTLSLRIHCEMARVHIYIYIYI